MNTTSESAQAPTLRLDGCKMIVGDSTAKLGAGEAVILGALLAKPGATVSPQELHAAMYGANGGAKSNVIEVLISRIRRKLKAMGMVSVIETIRLKGYRLAGDQQVGA